MKSLICLLGGVAALALASTASAQEKPITIVLSHANMAVGEEVFLYAVPKALGYFKDEGLDVTIQGASGGVQAGQVMASGNAQFITTLAEGVMQMREQGADPVAILSLKNYNGYSVSTLPDSGIKSLADLTGKTIGFPVAGGGTVMMLDESLKAAGLKPEYTAIVIGTGPGAAAAVEQKRVEAAVLWDANYGLIENLGYKLNYIDLPIQNEIAGFTLSTSDKMVKDDPKSVEGFCRAVLKGLTYTLANKEAAVDLFFKEFPTTKAANVSDEEATKDAVNVLNKWLDSALKGVTDVSKLGSFDKAKWEKSKELYAAAGTLKGTVPVDQAFTNQFIDGCNNFDHKAVKAQAVAAK